MTKENIEQFSGEGGEDVERYEQMAAAIRDRIGQLSLAEMDQYLTRLQEFKAAHPEVRRYLLWHRLIGSTVDEPMLFDAPDSLVRDLTAELYKDIIESNESA